MTHVIKWQNPVVEDTAYFGHRAQKSQTSTELYGYSKRYEENGDLQDNFGKNPLQRTSASPSISHPLLPYMAKQSQGFKFSAVTSSHGSRDSSNLYGDTYLTASPEDDTTGSDLDVYSADSVPGVQI